MLEKQLLLWHLPLLKQHPLLELWCLQGLLPLLELMQQRVLLLHLPLQLPGALRAAVLDNVWHLSTSAA